MKDEINYSEMLFNRDERLLDYITNLQTIEREYSSILSENAELENKITNLQQENERLKEDKKKARECINYYAIEDDDFNKLYNVEEQELLEILEAKDE